MKNKAFKLVLTIIIAGVLVFGVSFAKATANEDMIKILQSLIQVLQQMIVQLQTQLAQRNTTITTNPKITTTSINGVIYGESTVRWDSKHNKVNLWFESSFNTSTHYYISTPLDKIFINTDGQLRKAKFTDLTYGASVTVLGGAQQERKPIECCTGTIIDIVNPEKIIIDSPVVSEPMEYSGEIPGERSGSADGFYMFKFYPNLDYNLRLLKDTNEPPYTWIVSNKDIPELNRLHEAEPDSVIVKGRKICPKILSFPCTIWGDSIKVLSLQGGQPNEKLSFEGRLIYRYPDTTTNGLDTKYYFFIRVGSLNSPISDETIWVSNQTKFYLINPEGIKEQMDLTKFGQITYHDNSTDPTNPLLQVSAVKICDNDNLNLIHVCKNIADEVIVKSYSSFK